mmetsp:Transcript_8899/g.7887  ORF Transcript_8899/g.7887 Transcript_8899/m.7887 type:complete len:172 (+) Transcript_8899:443-958(+)
MDELLVKINKTNKLRQDAAEAKNKKEYNLASKNAEEIISKAKQELAKQAEEMNVKFRKKVVKEHLIMLETERSNIESMNAKEVDLTNYTLYVQEFYDKMKDLYIREYESRMKDMENINAEFEEKREQFKMYQTMDAPKEKVKINIDHTKIDPFKRDKGNIKFRKLEDILKG